MIVDSILTAGDEPSLIRQGDYTGGGQVLVPVGAIAFSIQERCEPVGDRQRSRISRIQESFTTLSPSWSMANCG